MRKNGPANMKIDSNAAQLVTVKVDYHCTNSVIQYN